MNEQEEVGVSLLEDNKLFVVFESGKYENYSEGQEKLFIYHCLNKFGYMDNSIIKECFDKVGFRLDNSFLSKNLIGPFSNNPELETYLVKLLSVQDYSGVILLSLKEFNEVLIGSKDIHETRKSLLKKGKLLNPLRKDASGRSFIKKIFG